MVSSTTKSYTQTLDNLNKLVDSEAIKKKSFQHFSISELKRMKSSDYRYLCKKKIEEFSNIHIQKIEKLPNEDVFRLEQSEVKNLTKALTNFHEQCKKDGLPLREFEEESVKYITDKYKRYFFGSKWAKRLYRTNNLIASSSLGIWGYKSLGTLANSNKFVYQNELKRNVLPIAYFTGVSLKFWSYITKPLPEVSKILDGLSSIAMSPIILVELVFNSITGPLFKSSPLQVEIPLNITGEIAAGSAGLTWDKLTHTINFVKNMTQNWET